MLNRASFYWHFHLFGTACSVMTKVTDVTRRCFDRSSDSIEMLMSVFLVRWEYHPRSAFTCLGEPASEGAGYRDDRDHQEDGHKH